MNGYYDIEKEKREARLAGQKALSSLEAADRELRHARGWGIWDILGGESLVGLIKHAKLNKANRYINQAKADLMVFQREMNDVVACGYLDTKVSGLLVFADFFLDGFLADILVQSKISDARKQVKEAKDRVEALLSQLN